MNTSTKDLLTSLLQRKPALDISANLERHACVALLLKGNAVEDLEIGFIQRAFSTEDRWSGQLAFPGGKREETDLRDIDTALRETREEIGYEIKPHQLLGRLDDIQARKAGHLLDFYIRPFIFSFEDSEASLILDPAEVADFFWIPIKELSNPLRQTSYILDRDHTPLTLPAIDLDRDPPLWGLTYMMCIDLLHRLS